MCIIAFIGSVFSPYYAAARRSGRADPLNHCAFNVVLTGATRRWCMTERGRNAVQRSSHALQIGPSAVRWDGKAYEFELHERGCPLPQALHGSVRVEPQLTPGVMFALDHAGQHHWVPLAPRARIEVRLSNPPLHWHGMAYLDANRGERALEHDFAGWQWSRTETADGVSVFYETQPRHESSWPLALRFCEQTVSELPLPPLAALPRSRWGIRRDAPAVDGPYSLNTLVDAPFYTRSLLRTCSAPQSLTVHESLDLDRFRRGWVQTLLPFRMPRRAAR